MRSLLKFASVITIGQMSLLACKPQAGSQVQSLDEYGSGAALNGKSCVGTAALSDPELQKIVVEYAVGKTKSCAEVLKTSNDDAKTIDSCKAAQASFSAVPGNVRDMYFKTFGLSVKLTDMASSYCSAAFSNPADAQFVSDPKARNVDGCVLYADSDKVAADARAANEKIGGTSDQKPLYMAMLLPRDAKLIGANVVRTMGMFITHLMPKMSKKGTGIFFDAKRLDSTQMATFKYDVADRFLKDLFILERDKVKHEGRTFSLDKLVPQLGSANVATLRTKLASLQLQKGAADSTSLKEVFDQLLATDGIRFQRFLGTAMAEAFDSGVCSGQTRTVAQELFPKTLSYYNTNTKRGLDDVLAQINTGMGLVSEGSNAAPSSGGLALNGSFFDLFGFNSTYFNGMYNYANQFYQNPYSAASRGVQTITPYAGVASGAAMGAFPLAMSLPLMQALNGIGRSNADCSNCGGSGCTCCANGSCDGGCANYA